MYENYNRYYIRLQDRDNGEIEEFFWDYPDGYPEDAVMFYWTDGNGACDCNRGLEFYHKRGQEDPMLPCSGERMILLGVWRENGTQIVESEE